MLVLLFFVIFTPIIAFSQLEQSNRVEFELKSSENEYEIIIGEEEIILYRNLNKYNKKGDELWQFMLLDTMLNKLWEREFYINKVLSYKGYDYAMGNYYFLFEQNNTKTKQLILIQMSGKNGDTIKYKIKTPILLDLTEFEVANNVAVLAGYYANEPVILHYNFLDKKTKILSGVFGSKTKLIQLKVENNLITALVSDKTYDKRSTLTIKKYSSSGEYLSTFTLNPEIEKSLIFARTIAFGKGSDLIAGTYSTKQSNYSQGLFLGIVDKEYKQNINYFNYADFENFFSYLHQKKRTKVYSKIGRKKIKGKTATFNYRLLVHEIFKQGNNYVLLGEAFYPKYKSSTYNNFYNNQYGSKSNNSHNLAFVGYQYTHAFVATFNAKGELLWDNSFRIDNVISPSLEQFVHASFTSEGIVLFYLYNSEIRSKIIKKSEIIENKQLDALKLSFQHDKINDFFFNKIGNLKKWYKNAFIAYGVQRIQRSDYSDSDIKHTRKVFYINKISSY